MTRPTAWCEPVRRPFPSARRGGRDVSARSPSRDGFLRAAAPPSTNPRAKRLTTAHHPRHHRHNSRAAVRNTQGTQQSVTRCLPSHTRTHTHTQTQKHTLHTYIHLQITITHTHTIIKYTRNNTYTYSHTYVYKHAHARGPVAYIMFVFTHTLSLRLRWRTTRTDNTVPGQVFVCFVLDDDEKSSILCNIS